MQKNNQTLPSEIKNNPYEYICDFAESLYPFTGKEVFEILSLLPCSLILDDIPYMSERIRTNLNVLFLTPSGGAKSSICKLFSGITYFPLEGRSYTPAELENKVDESPIFSLIIEDYATMSDNPRILKIIEGLLGEEKLLDRHTTKKDIHKDVNGVGLICGVPSDLSDKLTSGTIFRMVCIVLMHDDEEHSSIGEHINKNIGENGSASDKKKTIMNYYRTLQYIQSGEEDENGGIVPVKIDGKSCPPVKGFLIDESFRKIIYREWDSLTRFYRKNAPFNFFRELHDAYRVMVSFSFLNYFNREVKNGKIKITNEDCKMAVSLMKKTMQTKYELLMSERLAKSIRSLKQLQSITENKKIPDRVRGLIPIHIRTQLR